MSHDNKLPKTNSLLPSFNYKQFISLIILLLVTSSSTQAQYDCPHGCECNEITFSATCKSLDGLIASYSQKQHKSRHNFMPIKSLDLSNNELAKLTNQLELLVNLTELNLSHNQLTQVHKLNFDNLEKLDLSYNHITSAKLSKLPKNVVHLNLAHNEITYLPLDFMKLKKLRSLELVGNPINCTCNTLHVRNSLKFHDVWSDNVILCTSPPFVKGQPWLQARQNDICYEQVSTTTQKAKYDWANYDDENEVMMGDQPQDDGSGDADVQYDDETVDEPADDDIFDETSEKAATEVDDVDAEDDTDHTVQDDDEGFLPVTPEESHESSSVEPEAISKHIDNLYDDEEGSASEPITAHNTTMEEDDDGSGSGGGILDIVVNKDELTSEEPSEEFDDTDNGTLGIFNDDYTTEVAAIGVHRNPIEKTPNTETEEVKDPSSELTSPAASGDLKKASTDDNQGTYILLGILAVALISLIIFVAMKNKREKSKNRRGDIERNGATELQDMDKSLLGKPLDKNGNGKAAENSPLINDYVEKAKPATYTSFQPPAITVNEPVKEVPLKEKEKSQQSLYENMPNGNGNVEPVHQSPPSNGSIPKSPDSDEEVFLPATDNPNSPESLNVSPEPPKRYSPIYNPASPRSERYSPVYSPETGRVKIKLTETPKPKTPIVVTRSRSRAGDYVNTPN